MSIKYFFSLRVLVCSVFINAAMADSSKLVHSLGEVPDTVHNSIGQEYLAEQMSGSPPPSDNFGTNLPVGLSRESIIKLIAPTMDIKLATLVGAKSWPRQSGRFVAIACFAENDTDYDVQHSAEEARCAGEDHQVYIGLIAYDGHNAPQLLARYPQALNIPLSWADSPMQASVQASLFDDGVVSANSWSRFDFAPYHVRDQQNAFGVRLGLDVPQAGGGAYFEFLQLFIVEGSELKAIFSQPMYYTGDYAGEWHDDNTRDHTIEEDSAVLIILPHVSNGFHDIEMRGSGGNKWKRVFTWSPDKQRYETEPCINSHISGRYKASIDGNKIYSPVEIKFVRQGQCGVTGTFSAKNHEKNVVHWTLDACQPIYNEGMRCIFHDDSESLIARLDFDENFKKFSGNLKSSVTQKTSESIQWDGHRINQKPH